MGLTWWWYRYLLTWPLAGGTAPPNRVYWVIEQSALHVCGVEVASVVVNDPVACYYDFTIVIDKP